MGKSLRMKAEIKLCYTFVIDSNYFFALLLTSSSDIASCLKFNSFSDLIIKKKVNIIQHASNIVILMKVTYLLGFKIYLIKNNLFKI